MLVISPVPITGPPYYIDSPDEVRCYCHHPGTKPRPLDSDGNLGNHEPCKTFYAIRHT